MSFGEFPSLTELFTNANDLLSLDDACKPDKMTMRKLRNRASAAASRRRKQEMISSLRTTIEELQKENALLRREISRLQTTDANDAGSVSLVPTGEVPNKV